MNSLQTERRNQIRQAGFTLIELIMVIVILGILAAVAVPKFTDLSGEAEKAAADGVYAAAQSATATNFAAARAGKAGITLITNGATLLAALDGGAVDGWAASGATLTHTGNGTTYTITVASAETTAAKAQLSKSW
ncbi:MAG: prepilin-type N-terminal cleavage/methylation domain-containing protein [Magnetococcales bacterium]|nr:prepilin-type N-terminal cleavage/methylation domain-containing protein [Magnetococcales bacterium]